MKFLRVNMAAASIDTEDVIEEYAVGNHISGFDRLTGYPQKKSGYYFGGWQIGKSN